MNIVGEDYLKASISQDGYFIKFILNSRGVHFFPCTTEHRDASLPGLCYRDESMGDALAGTIKPTRIDLRCHRSFSPEQIKSICHAMEIAFDSSSETLPFDVYYGSKYVTTINLHCSDGAESVHIKF
jgi:hypothetical protein